MTFIFGCVIEISMPQQTGKMKMKTRSAKRNQERRNEHLIKVADRQCVWEICIEVGNEEPNIAILFWLIEVYFQQR